MTTDDLAFYAAVLALVALLAVWQSDPCAWRIEEDEAADCA